MSSTPRRRPLPARSSSRVRALYRLVRQGFADTACSTLRLPFAESHSDEGDRSGTRVAPGEFGADPQGWPGFEPVDRHPPNRDLNALVRGLHKGNAQWGSEPGNNRSSVAPRHVAPPAQTIQRQRGKPRTCVALCCFPLGSIVAGATGRRDGPSEAPASFPVRSPLANRVLNLTSCAATCHRSEPNREKRSDRCIRREVRDHRLRRSRCA